jgi:hypothetical protein
MPPSRNNKNSLPTSRRNAKGSTITGLLPKNHSKIKKVNSSIRKGKSKTFGKTTP